MGEEKTFSFGGCSFAKLSPPRDSLSSSVKKLNITISFDDALKLNLAIDECVRKLNKYKRSTTKGKKAALNLVIHLDADRVSVNES